MKKLFIIVLLSLPLVKSHAQEKIAYSIDKYYYASLNMDIASIRTWLLDSSYLKNLDPHVGGFNKSVDIPFTSVATKIENHSFNDYLLHVESVNGTRSVLSLYFELGEEDTIFIEYTNGKIDSKFDHTNHQCKEEFGCPLRTDFENEMIMRLRTGKADFDSLRVVIKHVHYTFGENTTIPRMKKSDGPFACETYAPCYTDYRNWINEHTGVFLIEGYFHTLITDYFVFSTGSLLNTTTNYDMNTSNVPYALMCQHFLKPVVDLGYINTIEEAFTGYKIKTRFKNQRISCDNDQLNPAILGIFPEFEVIELGNYMAANNDDEDFIFVEFDDQFTIQWFDPNNLGYVGWDNTNYSSTDYFDMTPFINFSHTDIGGTSYENKELRYAIDNNPPFIRGDLLVFHWDEGFTRVGSSGSPMFNSNHFMLAMDIAGDNADCYTTNPEADGLKFSTIWQKANLATYLGDASTSYNWNPNYSVLPLHCSDCIQNPELGEWGVDCGGPCIPCNPVHSDGTLYINGNPPEEYATSNQNIVIQNKFPTIPVLFDKNTIYTAKNEIELYNLEVAPGTLFILNAGVNSPLIFERECEEQCGVLFENVMVWGDWYSFRHKNVTHYEYTLIEGHSMHEIDSGEGNVYRNGWIDIANSDGWDLHHDASYVIYYEITLTDCIGTSEEYLGFFHIYPS